MQTAEKVTDQTIQSTASQAYKTSNWRMKMRQTAAMYRPFPYYSMNFDSRYQWGSLLGRGSMGIVAEVFDHIMGKKIACKTVSSGCPEKHLTTLVSEATVLCKLNHPNILPIFDMGELEDGRPYYTMEYIEGDNFEQFLKQEHNESMLEQGVSLLIQVAEALHYAHQKNIIHCDLKPANIMVTPQNKAIVIDWGTSETHTKAPVPKTKRENMEGGYKVNGTPLYLAPEVLRGTIATPYADQYAIGVMLYELLTQEHPFYEENVFMLFHHACFTPVATPRKRAPQFNIPKQLEAICLKLLSKDPEERYASCQDLAHALRSWKQTQRSPQSILKKSTWTQLKQHVSQMSVPANTSHHSINKKELRPVWFAPPLLQTIQDVQIHQAA